MSGRITKALIEAIIENAIKKQIKPQREHLATVGDALGCEVRDVRCGGIAAKYDAMAQKVADLYVELPYETRSHMNLSKNYKVRVEQGLYIDMQTHRYSLPMIEPVSNELLKRCQKHDQAIDALNDMQRQIKQSLETELPKFSTVKRLINEWQEIVELLPPGVNEKKALPAIPVQQLNTLLEIPSEVA